MASKEMNMKFIPIDYNYFDFQGRNYAKIIGRNESGKRVCVIDSCDVYLWAILKDNLKKERIDKLIQKVGNSLGIVIPSNVVQNNGLKEGQDLIVNIQGKNRTTVGDMMAEAKKLKLKFKKSTQEILDEIDEDSN